MAKIFIIMGRQQVMSKTDELTDKCRHLIYKYEKVNHWRNICDNLILLPLGNMTRLEEQGKEEDKGLFFLVVNFLASVTSYFLVIFE